MPGHPVPGHHVGGRYRLEAELGRGQSSVAWRAFDERLERPVAVRLFDPSIDRGRLEVRAGRAASLTHPRVVRVFDTGLDGDHFYTVSELVPGCLAWARLPLQPQETIDLGAQIAEALHYAHERGVAHGHLQPGNVMLAEGGAKVADFAIAGAIHGQDPDPRDDLRALGRLLYLTSTGREPGASAGDTRSSANEPAGSALVIRRLLAGEVTSAAEAMEALRSLRRRAPAQRRRPLTPAIVAVGAVLIAVAAFGATRLGERSPSGPLRPGERLEGTPHAIAAVDDFDPQGDGRENPRTVDRIRDGTLDTFWKTENYDGGPNFEGIRGKQGVGVIIDLGREVDVAAAQVLFRGEGCSVEIRHAAVKATDIAGWTRAAGARDAPATLALRFETTRARWWLVWITRLSGTVPGARGKFSCAIAEAKLFAPA